MKQCKIILTILLLILAGCKNASAPDKKKLEKIDGLYQIIYDLYQKLGYDEIDSLNRVYDSLDRQITLIDSLGKTKSVTFYDQLDEIHSDLHNYLNASSNFSEEIFTVEDNLSRLEYYVRSENISDSLFYERFNKEEQYLNDLNTRINDKRKIIMNDVSAYFRLKPRMNKFINTEVPE